MTTVGPQPEPNLRQRSCSNCGRPMPDMYDTNNPVHEESWCDTCQVVRDNPDPQARRLDRPRSPEEIRQIRENRRIVAEQRAEQDRQDRIDEAEYDDPEAYEDEPPEPHEYACPNCGNTTFTSSIERVVRSLARVNTDTYDNDGERTIYLDEDYDNTRTVTNGGGWSTPTCNSCGDAWPHDWELE